jgi:hypothetical protein
MSRIVPLLPPLSILVLIGGIAIDSLVGFEDPRPVVHLAPLLVAVVAYIAIGRRGGPR